MDEEIREKLKEQIMADFDEFARFKQYGTDERKAFVADLDKMVRLYAELYKIECEAADSADRVAEEQRQHKIENEFKQQQAAQEKRDKFIRYFIDGAAIVLPIVVSGSMLLIGWKFEETGSITSSFTKWLINRQRLTK